MPNKCSTVVGRVIHLGPSFIAFDRIEGCGGAGFATHIYTSLRRGKLGCCSFCACSANLLDGRPVASSLAIFPRGGSRKDVCHLADSIGKGGMTICATRLSCLSYTCCGTHNCSNSA